MPSTSRSTMRVTEPVGGAQQRRDLLLCASRLRCRNQKEKMKGGMMAISSSEIR